MDSGFRRNDERGLDTGLCLDSVFRWKDGLGGGMTVCLAARLWWAWILAFAGMWGVSFPPTLALPPFVGEGMDSGVGGGDGGGWWCDRLCGGISVAGVDSDFRWNEGSPLLQESSPRNTTKPRNTTLFTAVIQTS